MSTLNIDRINIPKVARNGRIYGNYTSSTNNSVANSVGNSTPPNLQVVTDAGNSTSLGFKLTNITDPSLFYSIYVDDNGHLRFSGIAGTSVISDGDIVAHAPVTLPIENAWEGLPIDNDTIKFVGGVFKSSGGVSSWNELLDKPTFATVATTGSYNDLYNKPTIPSISGLASTSYVDTKVANLVDSAPTTLDTLNELAVALGNDPNFATSTATLIGQKQDSSTAINTSNISSQSVDKATYAQILNPHNDITNYSIHSDNWNTSMIYKHYYGHKFYGAGVPIFTFNDNNIWHAGNLNRSDTDFNAKNLYASGNLSIGTQSTTYVLDIQKSYTNIRFKTTSGTPEAYANFENNSGGFYVGSNNNTGNGLLNAPYVPYAGVVATMGAYPVVLGTSGVSRLLIDSNGNVGIGTTTPKSYLTMKFLSIDGVLGGAVTLFKNGVEKGEIEVSSDGMIYSSANGSHNFNGNIVAETGLGFQNKHYQAGINPIWAFATAPTYGIAYKQGFPDDIRFHFGSTANPEFIFTQEGNLTATGDITAYSDITLKENLKPLNNILSKLNKIQGYTYNRKDKDGKQEIGLVAQELETVFPELVHSNNEGIKSVDYMKFTAVLLQAIKELERRIK